MNIAVVGTGYVGLVSGTCFAETGNTVICVDIDEKKVEKMKAGEVPIYEPGLKPLFDRNIRETDLRLPPIWPKRLRSLKLFSCVFQHLPAPMVKLT